jgi:CHAT domain-containing protein
MLDDVWAGHISVKPGCVISADACETGQVDPDLASEESLGFPAAFLGAGASAVIASLWAVDDLATALLMDKTYELMLPPQGLSPAGALRQAGQWLRRLTKAEALGRLRRQLQPLEQGRQEGKWPSLDRATFHGLHHRLRGLRQRLCELEEGPDAPFAHPVFWAAFAASGA